MKGNTIDPEARLTLGRHHNEQTGDVSCGRAGGQEDTGAAQINSDGTKTLDPSREGKTTPDVSSLTPGKKVLDAA